MEKGLYWVEVSGTGLAERMDGFNIIQHFFTRMRCNFCNAYLESEGIELVREDQGVFVVNIHCVQCDQQMGMALVGLEGSEFPQPCDTAYEDPELTPAELERLAESEPINYDDVLNAHAFFKNLDANWKQHLPPGMRSLEIVPEPECPED